jgi:hypothetical protein
MRGSAVQSGMPEFSKVKVLHVGHPAELRKSALEVWPLLSRELKTALPLPVASRAPSCKMPATLSMGVDMMGPMTTDRRHLLLLLAAGAAWFPGSAFAAEALKKLRVGKAINSSFPFAGLELGVRQAIWKAAGLDIEISSFRGDGQLQQALAAGSVDFGYGSGPGMGYAAKGVPAHAVAVVANPPANMALVAAKDSHVVKLEDLKGKRIGVSTAGSLTDWLATVGH